MKQNGFTLIEAALVVAIISICVAVMLVPHYACKIQAEQMGFRHDWGLFKGCMIEPKPGQWVPLKNYRVL